MLFKSRRNEYADTDGPVRYLDDSGLRRPLDMPRPQIAIMFAFVLVAALIGGYLLFNVLDAVRGGTARAQASVEENLSREVSYDLPALTSYITLNDDEIKQAVADAGLTVIDKGGMSDDPEAALELIKLPSDVSELDAGLMYNKGVSKLSASEAALLLNGSWTLDADRSDGTSMRLRYADFSSGSLDAAIDAAIAAEGFYPATIAGRGRSGQHVQAGHGRRRRDRVHMEGLGSPFVRDVRHLGPARNRRVRRRSLELLAARFYPRIRAFAPRIAFDDAGRFVSPPQYYSFLKTV